MLPSKQALALETKEELLAELKEYVAVRDKMSGALYWNIMNDDCCAIANKCVEKGCDRAEVSKILGEGNFR